MYFSVFAASLECSRATCTIHQSIMLMLQPEAKRAVANALRNRWRRHKIASPMKVNSCCPLILYCSFNDLLFLLGSFFNVKHAVLQSCTMQHLVASVVAPCQASSNQCSIILHCCSAVRHAVQKQHVSRFHNNALACVAVAWLSVCPLQSSVLFIMVLRCSTWCPGIFV